MRDAGLTGLGKGVERTSGAGRPLTFFCEGLKPRASPPLSSREISIRPRSSQAVAAGSKALPDGWCWE